LEICLKINVELAAVRGRVRIVEVKAFEVVQRALAVRPHEVSRAFLMKDMKKAF
jgi:hypothetical protein